VSHKERALKKTFFCALGCTLVATLAPRAGATLGDDAASVAANAQRLKGSHVVRQLASVERHELLLPSGVLVEQYVAPGGKVFAIAWHGPRVPNLRELLGNYFGELANGPRLGHHLVMVRGSDVVIQSSGHRLSFSGRAWVPSLVPTGVQLESLFGARPR
jgi:hypothetical protein